MTSGIFPARAELPAPPATPGPVAPTLWRAAAWRYAYDACACLLLALPVRNATVASGIGAFPDAAQRLQLDGGVWLLEVLRSQQAGLGASLSPVFWGLLLSSWLALVPEWWLLRAVLAPEGGLPLARAFSRLSSLALGTWALRALLWAGGIALALFVRARLEHLPDPRAADLAACAVLLVTLLMQLNVSVLRDLAALQLVHGGQRVLAAVGSAARGLHTLLPRLAIPYSAYRLLSFAALLGAHCLSVALAQRGHGGLALWAVLLGLAARVALEALWLRWLAASAP